MQDSDIDKALDCLIEEQGELLKVFQRIEIDMKLLKSWSSFSAHCSNARLYPIPQRKELTLKLAADCLNKTKDEAQSLGIKPEAFVKIEKALNHLVEIIAEKIALEIGKRQEL